MDYSAQGGYSVTHGASAKVLILPVTRVQSAQKLPSGSFLDRYLSVMCDPYPKSA
jgi:hypothetical protein